jgi:hypothetical protein
LAKNKAARRRDAADEVCFTLLLMMELGGLDIKDKGWREFLGKPMEKWADLAVDTGILKK